MDRGGGLNLPEIVKFNEVKCAKFDGNSRLQLQDTTPIKSLKEWTMQVWIYPTRLGSYESQSMLFTTYTLGSLWSDSFFNLSLYTPTSITLQQVQKPIASILNSWHHVKVTTNGSNLILYLDNQKLVEINSYSVNITSPPITIGNEAGNYGLNVGFYGYMTQFKFSDKYNDNDLLLNDSKFIYINKNNEVWAMV